MKILILSILFILLALCGFSQKLYDAYPGEYNCSIVPRFGPNANVLYEVGSGVPFAVTGAPLTMMVSNDLHDYCLIGLDSNAYCWGNNSSGAVGNGQTSATILVANPTKITQDSSGNPFTSLKYIQSYANGYYNAPGLGYATGFFGIKSDGTLWVWGATQGGMRGNGQTGQVNTRPVQVFLPGGRKAVKVTASIVAEVLCTDGSVWAWGGNVANGGSTLWLGTNNPDYTNPHQVPLPYTAADINQGQLWSFAVLTNASVYAWGYDASYWAVGNTGFNNQQGSLTVPQLTDTSLNFAVLDHNPTVKVWQQRTTSMGTYYILTDSTLWFHGDNVHGNAGIGTQLDWANFTINPAPTGGTAAPFNWNQQLALLLLQKPVQIAPGKHDFIWIAGGLADVYYEYAEDSHGQLYAWGRNKGSMQGNGIISQDPGGQAAIYPDGWNVPWITPVNPLSIVAVSNTPAQECAINPAAQYCSTNPVSPGAIPNVSAGSNQSVSGSTATLAGTATGNNSAKINYYLWTQDSGPTSLVIPIRTASSIPISGLTPGTYVFRLTVTDNNWRTNFSTVTVTVGGTPAVNKVFIKTLHRYLPKHIS